LDDCLWGGRVGAGPENRQLNTQESSTGPSWRYACDMRSQLEPQPPRTPILRKAAAGLVLVAVAALVIHVVVGLVLAVFWVFVALAAVVAVLWALKTLVW
jgi:hypothetical protein